MSEEYIPEKYAEYREYDEESAFPAIQKINLPSSSPLACADGVLQQKKHLHYARWRGQWYVYGNGYYMPASDEWINASTRRVLERFMVPEMDKKTFTGNYIPILVKKTTVSETVDSMMSRDGVMIGDTQDAPLWRGKNNTNATDIFAAKNGLFNLKNGDFTPHDHTYFSLGASDFNFQHGAQCPNWEAWLAKVFIKDQAQIRLLQEWFGYCLTYDCSQRKVMLLLGITTSGKGTILNILTSLLGRKNMVACEPVDTTEKWFGATIFGKRLVNFFDLRMGGRLDTTAFGSVILKLAEGAPTKIEQKGKPIFTAPTFAKVTIASNNLPRFVDSSSAVAGRFLSLRFTESFLGREDKGLDARLNAELPGIFLWALAGLERLRDNEWRWTIHNAGESIRSQMADDCSPVRRFVDDECIIDPDSETEKQNLFKFWKVYCAERNIQNIGTDAIFSTKLHDAFPQLEHGRPSKDGKYLPRTHIGIRIKYSHE